MKRSSNYNTKQSEAILSYIASLDGEHVTAAQIAEHFENAGQSVGLTTVYRHLDKLIACGWVRKYNIDGISGACYQHIDNVTECKEHFHLKCESCGALVHLQCDLLDKIERHITKEHAFKINSLKTVFYGRCNGCADSDRGKQ